MGRSTIITYMRHQVIGFIPTRQMLGSLHQVTRQFDGVKQFFSDGGTETPASDASSSGGMGDAAAMFTGIWRPADMTRRNESFWLTPGYHHAGGIMPWKDSVTLGFNYQRDMMRDTLHILIKPYLGEGWAHNGSMWGTEASMNFGGAGRPNSASISLRYDDGDAALAGDHRGFDMHGDWAIRRNLSLTIGARAREGEDRSGYALIGWRWAIGTD